MLKRIHHVNICVSDLDEARSFFCNLLGFEQMDEARLEGEWIDRVVGLKGVDATYVQLGLPHSEAMLELIQYRAPEGGGDAKIAEANRLGLRHLAFEVSDIEGICEKLKNAGVRFFSDIQNYGHKKLCYFYGPDDVILELAEFGEEK